MRKIELLNYLLQKITITDVLVKKKKIIKKPVGQDLSSVFRKRGHLFVKGIPVSRCKNDDKGNTPYIQVFFFF